GLAIPDVSFSWFCLTVPEVSEKINQQCGSKKRCLRRTLTGPW
ncbi:hypothetical protein Taro_043235, partial [Colocasia esculenta]|nr:hypothetical protein [Colocasia esculenta]